MNVTHGKEDYDASCKRLLSEKQVLALILKSCVQEFSEIEVERIANSCIDGTPFVSKVPIEPDSTGSFLRGLTNELISPTEGTVRFDIYFDAIVPDKNEIIRLIINIEAQKDFDPCYQLLRRGVFYCCRMISSQYESVFERHHYEKIRKVYSIWICTKTPIKWNNTINTYCINENNIVGNAHVDVKNYDLMTIVMICIGRNNDEKSKGILRFLATLLLKDVPLETKKNIISNEYNIKLTKTMDKELSLMCNLSEGIYEDGYEKGKMDEIENTKRESYRADTNEQLYIGEKKRADDAEKALFNAFKNMMNRGYSIDEASDTLCLHGEKLENFKSKL